jgi:ubiquinol-cytochrome c reductase cytochrome c subunit
MKLLLVTLAVIASLVPAAAQNAQTAPAAPAAATAAGNVETGKKLYTSYGCYQCHGFEGQGSSATGPRLAPRPLPLAALTRYVRRPTGQMPPYGPRIVSDADLADIHAYLTSRPAPAPLQSIPLLQQ